MSQAISLITRQQLAATAAARWMARHGPRAGISEEWATPEAAAKYDALLALGDAPDPEAVEAIVGPYGMKRRCTICYRPSDALVQLPGAELMVLLCPVCVETSAQLLRQRGRQVHPFTDVADNVVVGEGSRVWAFAIICPGVRIGQRCAIGSKVYIGRETVLGDDVRIQDGSHLTDRMVVGHRVFMGALVVTMNDKHPRVNNPDYVVEPPVIDDDVMIGCGAVILPGVRLHRGCRVGAGAVVTKDVPEGETWIGNPAHPISWRRGGQQSSLADDVGIDWSLYTRLTGDSPPADEGE